MLFASEVSAQQILFYWLALLLQHYICCFTFLSLFRFSSLPRCLLTPSASAGLYACPPNASSSFFKKCRFFTSLHLHASFARTVTLSTAPSRFQLRFPLTAHDTPSPLSVRRVLSPKRAKSGEGSRVLNAQNLATQGFAREKRGHKKSASSSEKALISHAVAQSQVRHLICRAG